MSRDEMLRRLGGLHGIVHGYHDIWGGWHEPGERTLVALLEAMGVAVGEDEALAEAIEAAETRQWRRTMAPVQVTRVGEPIRVPVVVPGAVADLHIGWTLTLEDGTSHRGEARAGRLESIGEREVAGQPLRRVIIEPGVDPGEGYHRLAVVVDRADPVEVRLVVAPARCHLPAALAAGARVWGVTMQLYALRSSRNWGMGDLGDLNVAVDALAALGADLVGINPLHAPFLDHPEWASPYSPSSRRFLNPLYLDVEALEDFPDSAPARAFVASAAFRTRLAGARASELVDHAAVGALKLETLTLVHRSFHERHLLPPETTRGRAFRAFQSRGGEALRRHAAFEALGVDAVRRGARAEAADATLAEMHEYLQWQTEVQLAACAEHATRRGMRVGLYMDLAVGADRDGAEIWASPRSFAIGASLGAPPDDFSPTGQVWNLPPWRPDTLIESAFEPFAETLRAAMRAAGALRIDHVIGLLRQFWVPEGLGAADGAYVGLPLHDLLSILALESVRHGCVVIGEDLGTVPDEMRAALHEHGVLSYRVLYFERHWHGDHSFKRPGEFPADALVTVSTHDLPTLAGFWTGHDLEVRDALGLLPGDRPIDVSREHRAGERTALLAALRAEGLTAQPHAGPGTDALPRDLSLAVHRYVARTPSLVLSVQIEDVIGMPEQANLPGTVAEQPNWRRRIDLPVESWADDERLHALGEAVRAERA